MNFQKVAEILGGLRILPFFPSDEHALLALVSMVGSMVDTEEQVRWLVKRMTSGIYSQWPGPQEMRACFCGRFKPKDGINAYSTVYLDGIPPERPAIAAPEQKALPPGGAVTEDTSMDAAFQILQRGMVERNRGIGGPATEAEIRAAPEWLRRLEGFE